MAEATESKYFVQNKQQSLNSTVNSQEDWQLDIKYYLQAQDALDRLQTDLQEGVLQKMTLLRQQQMEKTIASKCYKNNDYTFLQAQKCEEFHYKNDYKLNMIRTFVPDFMTKHLKDYEQCWTGPEFTALATNEEKDRMFLQCHKKWIRNLKENVSVGLEAKAYQSFQ